jgi:hypothetical protein
MFLVALLLAAVGVLGPVITGAEEVRQLQPELCDNPKYSVN